MIASLTTLEKLTQLTALFQDMEQALIAYSGGIDSTLVAKVAYDTLGDRALAITAESPSLLPKPKRSAFVMRSSLPTKWIIPTTPATPLIAAIFVKANCTTL
jgi:NH3-dependent NAD+ synthetase